MKKYEDRIDAYITRKDGSKFVYEVFASCVKCDEEGKLNSEEEVLDSFYELVDNETMDSWNAKEIQLVYSWGKEIIETTIYQ